MYNHLSIAVLNPHCLKSVADDISSPQRMSVICTIELVSLAAFFRAELYFFSSCKILLYFTLLSFGLKLHIKKKKRRRSKKTDSKTRQNGQGSRYSLANYSGPPIQVDLLKINPHDQTNFIETAGFQCRISINLRLLRAIGS